MVKVINVKKEYREAYFLSLEVSNILDIEFGVSPINDLHIESIEFS